MTVTTDHFHEQLSRSIGEELDYLLKDIDHYEVPIRIEDALTSAKEELDMLNGMMELSGLKDHLLAFSKAIGMLKICRAAISSLPNDAFGVGGDPQTGETWPIRDELIDKISEAIGDTR